MASMVDSWVVVDKTSGGELRAKASHESLYISDLSASKPRVHIQKTTNKSLAPELMDWINNSAQELPVAERNPSTTSSYKTNSSSVNRRTMRRSSIHGTGDFGGLQRSDDCYNDGMFVVKVLEVRQVGANKPMNLQCVAQVGDEKFAIAPVQTQCTGGNVWAAKMDDTFVFDVSRQFTFNLAVLGTHMAPVRRHPTISRITMSKLHLGSQVSVATTQTVKSKKRISGLFSKMFRNKHIANDPVYTGNKSRVSLSPSTTFLQDDVLLEEATDESGRPLEIQRHSVYSPTSSTSDFGQAPESSRFSGYFPRARANTTATEASVFRPRLRTFSNASQITPQSLGELFLDFRVDRREKRRTTLTLPAVNQAQEAMRGGNHVEVQVLLEYGILVNETYEERLARQQQERISEERMMQQRRRQETEMQWEKADRDDRQPRLRGFVSVFTRSGRISTWKRYWAVLSSARIELFDNEKEHEPVSAIPLFHLHDAGVPETDLVNLGPTGIELRLSPLAMTDRHRRQSAHPRQSDAMEATLRDIDVNDLDDDDAALVQYCDWQCRVYILLGSLPDRDLWLHELRNVTVPSAEFARFRARQRRQWRNQELSLAAEQLRRIGRNLQVVHGQAMPGLSEQETLSAKQAFLESIGRTSARVVSMSGICGEFGGNTLTNAPFAPRLVNLTVRKPSGSQRLPLPAALCSDAFPRIPSPPPQKKMRARRDSSELGLPGTAVAKDRNVSGGSTVIQVMGTAKERRQGTVSRRFLFVWSVNDL